MGCIAGRTWPINVPAIETWTDQNRPQNQDIFGHSLHGDPLQRAGRGEFRITERATAQQRPEIQPQTFGRGVLERLRSDSNEHVSRGAWIRRLPSVT